MTGVLPHASGGVARAARVLILSADMGSGHDSVARALTAELAQARNVDVVVRNGLADAQRAAYAVMKRAMEGHVTHAPSTYGPMYDLTTRPFATGIIREGVDLVYGGGLERTIRAHNPDVVVSTFPMITSAAGTLREEGRIAAPVVGLVIDSDPHAMWFARGADQHLVFNPGDIARTRALGVRHPMLANVRVDSVRPAVDERFAGAGTQADRATGRLAFGLPEDGPTLLVSGGSRGQALGVRQMQQLAHDADITVAVATARNTKLLSELERLGDAQVVGVPFTADMPTLVRSSDAVLSTSGGMTTYEAFAAGVPVLFHHPLPGHGDRAARALADDGLATFAEGSGDLTRVAASLATGSPQLAHRADAARGLFAQRPLGEAVLAHVGA